MTSIRKKLHVLLVLLCFFNQPTGATAEEQRSYTVGVVPQFETRHLRSIWRPILQRIENEAGIKLILRGSPTIPDFENEFNLGRFDFAYMNPYHLILANNAQGYLPLTSDTGKKLQGILVVRADSTIESAKELDGKIVAFPAPNALGASLLMRAELLNKFGLSIIPSYVKTHSSVYLNVALSEASAGGGVQKTLDQQADHIRNQLRVIHRTQEIAPHPFTVHPRISKDVRDRVKAALLKLGETETGRTLLKKVPISQIGPASMADYQALKDMGLDRFYVTH